MGKGGIMRYWHCKCGKCEAFGSDPPKPCMVCPECGTDYMGNPPKDHDWVVEQTETDEGPKPLSRCRYCYKTKGQLEKYMKGIKNEQTISKQL